MKSFLFKIIIFLTILVVCPIGISAAHSVILKSGTTIKGNVVGQNEKGLTIKLTDGSTQTIPKNKILKVVYKDVSADEEKKIRVDEEKKLQAQKAKEEAARQKKEEAEAKKLAEKQLKEEEAQRKKDEEAAKKLAAEEGKKASEEERASAARAERIRIAHERARTEGTRSTFDVVWRSAVLPSWGLYHADRPISATIYSGLFWGPLLYAVNLKKQVITAKSNYDNASLFYQVARPDPVNFLTPAGFDVVGYYFADTYTKDYVSSAKKQYKAKTAQYHGALGTAALVYIIQLTHSFIVGSNWVLEEFLEPESVVQKGFEMDSRWEATGVSWELRSDIQYSWRF
jgi:hypothetical protein